MGRALVFRTSSQQGIWVSLSAPGPFSTSRKELVFASGDGVFSGCEEMLARSSDRKSRYLVIRKPLLRRRHGRRESGHKEEK